MSARGPVGVTRPAGQAAELVRALGERGVESLVVPLLEVDLDPAAVEVGLAQGPDWVAVTSANGARALVAALAAGARSGGVRLAAVGAATAGVLEAAGWPVEVVPVRADADAVLAELVERPPGRILLPLGDRARPVLARGLAAAGWQVDRVEAYRVAPRPPSSGEGELLSGCRLITATSPSIVEVLAAHLEPCPPLVVIGSTTAQRARELGLEVLAEADPRSAEGLAAACSQVLDDPGWGLDR